MVVVNLNGAVSAENQTVLLNSGVGCDASGVPSHSREQTIPWSAHKAKADRAHQAVGPPLAPARPSCAFHPAAGLCFRRWDAYQQLAWWFMSLAWA